jgi:hypothetical protein
MDDWASLKSKKRYTKRDVESLLSVFVVAMQLPPPILNARLALPFDI